MGTILGFSAILKNFRFFWKFSKTRPSMAHWAKKISKNVAQNMFKSGLDTFGKDFGHFCNFKKFLIFLRIFEDSTRPTKEQWAKKFFEIITPKHVQNTFGQLWERFWVCLEFWKNFDFFGNFRRLDPPWNTGQKNFLEKIAPKHVQNTFGHSWERFWAFLEFWKVFWFFWNLSTTRPSKEHWVKKLFQKKRP